MAEVNDSVNGANKQMDKHNTGLNYYAIMPVAPATETRPPSAGTGGQDLNTQPPPVRPLNRTDSRSALLQQSPRPLTPTQAPPRPQFQPGGPVSTPPPFAPRSANLGPRVTVPPGPPGSQQIRPTPQSLRPLGPQSIAPQQILRPQSPSVTQAQQRAPPPNSLQFGPRQPPVGAVTPEGTRPQVQYSNGSNKNGVSNYPSHLPRQSSQSSLKDFDQSKSYQNKSANLDNQNDNNEIQGKAENGIDIPGVPKGRSYSIAAAPGAPSPLKAEDDRRKSVSAIGGKIDEFAIRSPGLGLIQEGKIESKDNIRGSTESVRSEASNEGGKDVPERPESRLSGSKMTESIIGSLTNIAAQKKSDTEEKDVQKNLGSESKVEADASKTLTKAELSDRSPSLTRSDDSPEPKPQINASQNSVPPNNLPTPTNKSQRTTPEPPRPKTPKIDLKTDIKTDTNKDSHAKTVTTPSKIISKSPITEVKTAISINKPNELNTSLPSTDIKKSTPRKSASAPKSRPKDGDNDSGVDESTQGNDVNGSPSSPNKKLPSKLPTKEKSSNSLKPSLSRSSSKSATAKTPENPSPADKKKVPMNKVQVGNAPSPNIKAVKSKIGSLDNATYKPGGGKIKIENRKIEFGNVTPKIAAKNDAYTPSGGAKKIITTKLEWNAKSKIGSLQNASYKPGGGDKKIETQKLDFKDKAKPKVASTVNITHKPGGGTVKIENQKLEIKAHSKVGSLDNVKHKPGGGEVKIFDDKDYIKQMTGHSPLPDSLSHSRQESPLPPTSQQPKSDENLNQQEV